jgi:hypothetical protein
VCIGFMSPPFRNCSLSYSSRRGLMGQPFWRESAQERSVQQATMTSCAKDAMVWSIVGDVATSPVLSLKRVGG